VLTYVFRCQLLALLRPQIIDGAQSILWLARSGFPQVFCFKSLCSNLVKYAIERANHYNRPISTRFHIASFRSLATSLGFSATAIPASFIALIFAAAVPELPLMIAPAWPIRFPGGAVLPAIKPTTGRS
jgi:hypothetical protein